MKFKFNFSQLILPITFTILKLTDQLDWSWFWILSPVWIGLMFMGLSMIVLVIAVSDD